MAAECSSRTASDYFSQPKREASSSSSYNFSSPAFAWDQSPYSSAAPGLSSSSSLSSSSLKSAVVGDSLSSVLLPGIAGYSSSSNSNSLGCPVPLSLSLLSPPLIDSKAQLSNNNTITNSANTNTNNTTTTTTTTTFDDWMRWDDPESNALSPLELIEPFSSALKVEPVSPQMDSISPAPRSSIHGGGGAGSSGNVLDDTSMDFDDSLADEPLFTTSSFAEDLDVQDGSVAVEGLYSTPLSWTEPAPGRRSSSKIAAGSVSSPSRIFNPQSSLEASGSRRSSSNNSNNTTTAATLYPIDLSRIHPTESTHFASPLSSPEPTGGAASSSRRSRKHKHARLSEEDDDDDDEDSSTSPPPPPSSSSSRRHAAPKKTAHNMIEKRYRTNLNDKITALRDSVPSLRLAAEAAGKSTKSSSSSRHHSQSQSPLTPNGGMLLDGSVNGMLPARNEPHPKLNKATVLSKATEYIAQLEKRSNHLSRENAHLKARIDAFETLLMGQGVHGGQGAQRPIYEVGRKPERVLPPLQNGRW